jgi:hypothetical protein
MTLRPALWLALALTVAAPTRLFASGADRVQFFQNIDVGPDEKVGDVVCLACSIRMAGSAGDTVAILGSIVVDGKVNGDVVAVAGGIRLNEDASVSGDTVAVGKGLQRHPNATVKGEIVSQSGPLVFLALIFGLFVVPLLPIVLIVALIVWLLRRNSYPRPAPVAYRR